MAEEKQRSLLSCILNPSNEENFASNLFKNNILPTIKHTTEDVLCRTIHYLIFKDANVAGPGYNSYGPGKYNNASYSNKTVIHIQQDKPLYDERNYAIHVPGGDLNAKSRANTILYEDISGQLEQYGQVTIGDIHRFCGRSSNVPWNTNEVGWVSVEGMEAPRLITNYQGRPEYIIQLPKPIKLDPFRR